MVDVIRTRAILGSTIRQDGFAFQVDATIHTSYEYTAEAVKHPVEIGPDRTDHIQVKAFRLTIDAIISNTPLGTSETDFGFDRDFDAWDQLVETMNIGEVVTIVDSVGTFENMAFLGLTMSRDRSTGQAIRPSMVFEQIHFVEAPLDVFKSRGRQPVVEMGEIELVRRSNEQMEALLRN